VYAGSSIPGIGIDGVIGDVIARSGDVLTVRGATVVRNSDGPHFARGTVKVTLGLDTKVVKGGTVPAQVVDIGAISVGQSIVAFGTASPVTANAMSGDWTLDATAGRVRMIVTPIFGFVKETGTGALTLQLDSIGGRRVSAFDFSGTGTAPGQDADPANYQVATGALDLSGLRDGEATKLFGFPTPFGAAPPDFTARTVVDYRRMSALLAMSWGRSGTTAPFSSQEPTGLVLDLDNDAIGRAHHISIGPRVLDLARLPASPAIVPPEDGHTAYLIVMRDQSHSFEDFADFVADLGTRLNGTTVMFTLTATGSYDGDASVFTARTLVVTLK
jgi:hypothetical protein